MALLVANIDWPGVDGDPVPAIAERLRLGVEEVAGVRLLRRAVDGRIRPAKWLANYRVELRCEEAPVLQRRIHGVRAYSDRDRQRWDPAAWTLAGRVWPKEVRPIVVGAGPAGLFAALRLGEAGAPVTLLERGGPVEERHHAVRKFWRHGVLDPETNVVFGEGGAGAFSDGKIYTRRRDGALGWVFQRWVDMGADPEILEEGWAHLGTDRIRAILPRLRERLIELGVEVRFHAAVTGFLVEGGACRGVRLADGEELRGGPVIVGTGHSARDVWAAMIDAGAAAELRPIHVGARIEHPQALIDRARYGSPRGDLPPASYRLRSNPRPRGQEPVPRRAHTFCMCPGGTVVGASNHPGRVVVNGMSYSKRQAWFANSAIIVAAEAGDYPGTDALAGTRYQDAIEAKAFALGGGAFRAPAQLVGDFLAGKASDQLPRTSFTMGTTPSDLREVLPEPIWRGMEAALRHFDRRVPGFGGPDGVLIAPETRTTAPLRFLRGPTLESTSVRELLPVGEGAGYAGGIISAALDGFRAAEALVARVMPRLADPDR